MGLIKNIGNAVKSEVRDYLLKIVEAEKEAPKQPETEKVQKPVEVKVEQQPKVEEKPVIKEEKVQPEKVEEVAEAAEKPRRKEIYPIATDLEFVRVSYKKNQDGVMIPKDLAELIKMLPLEEYACFVKLYCFALEQRKNYGYWGGTLKRRIGLDQLTTAQFEELGNNLAAYGLLLLEQLTENQKTFVLYVPFDEESMNKLSVAKPAAKQPEKQTKKQQPKPAPKQQPKAKAEPEKEPEAETQRDEDIPGKPVEGMEDDEMYKSYKTFVSLEIDKAKMRVGRANFDKIYMEAVKYIDKKYGFKVLSDSDKFKEYLTNYYISAFDIPTFENWKKSKG